jgi:hypothetical protein
MTTPATNSSASSGSPPNPSSSPVPITHTLALLPSSSSPPTSSSPPSRPASNALVVVSPQANPHMTQHQSSSFALSPMNSPSPMATSPPPSAAIVPMTGLPFSAYSYPMAFYPKA